MQRDRSGAGLAEFAAGGHGDGMDGQQKSTGTIDAAEIEHFSRLSRQWWDTRGPLKALHKFNPVRVAYIRDRAAAHFGRDRTRADCLAGVSILDIGCGGGILSEPLAQLGANFVGLDPAQSNIAVARHHAAQAGLAIDYRCIPAETLAAGGAAFDVVLAMEVIEHVADVGLFVELAAGMVKPGGLAFFATFNRTLKSFVLGIIAAEYILRWVPAGTHQWRKFITPDELTFMIQCNGLRVIDRAGVSYRAFSHRWQLSANMDMNYMILAARLP
jgi:2-polyprenyl-6-hydroxyphenyl methylase / 3-demethylubiquinone-9 3-methyltransferase